MSNEDEKKKYIDEIVKPFIELCESLFSFYENVPPRAIEFIQRIKENFEFLYPELLEQSEILPFLLNILSHYIADNNINNDHDDIICIVIQIFIKLVEQSVLSIDLLFSYDFLSYIEPLMGVATGKIQTNIALLFLTIIEYSDVSEEIINTVNQKFFQQAYIWASNLDNPECLIYCLDFCRIVIEEIGNVNEETLSMFTNLLKDLIIASPIKNIQFINNITPRAYYFLSRLIKVAKRFSFNPAEMFSICFSQMEMYNNSYPLIYRIIEFLAYSISLMKEDLHINLSCLHQVFNFSVLFKIMSIPSNYSSSIQKYISLIIESFSCSDPESINLLLQNNFVDFASEIFDEGIVFTMTRIANTLKNIFYLATPSQLIIIFKSKLIYQLIQFLEINQDVITAPCLESMSVAIKRCIDHYGQFFLNEIHHIFNNECIQLLESLANSDNEEISSNAENLLDIVTD